MPRGLVDDYHRWIDPAIGRWLSEDPSGFRAGDMNLMRYTGNNPLRHADPTGLLSLDGYSNWVQSWSPVNYASLGNTIYNYLPSSAANALANASDAAVVTGTAVAASGIVFAMWAAAPALGSAAASMGTSIEISVPTITVAELSGAVAGGGTMSLGGWTFVSGSTTIAVSTAAMIKFSATAAAGAAIGGGIYVWSEGDAWEEYDDIDTVLESGEDTVPLNPPDWPFDVWIDSGPGPEPGPNEL